MANPLGIPDEAYARLCRQAELDKATGALLDARDRLDRNPSPAAVRAYEKALAERRRLDR